MTQPDLPGLESSLPSPTDDGGKNRGDRGGDGAGLRSPAALVTSQVAEGSDDGPGGQGGLAGPPRWAWYERAVAPDESAAGRASSELGAAVDAAAALSLAQTPVDCNPPELGQEWWTDFRQEWAATIEQRVEASPRTARGFMKRHDQLLADCGTSFGVIACGCKVKVVPWGCRQDHVCPRCRPYYAGRIRRRFNAAIEQAERTHPRWHWVHLRVSLAQEGDLEATRAAIQLAWQRFRAAVRKRIGSSFPYGGCWEFTVGGYGEREGRGNLHVHWVMRWPFVEYGWVHEEWQRATDGLALPGCGSWIESVSTAKSAVRYLTKYATKGVEPLAMPALLAARLLGTFYWRRWVQTSRGWWAPRVRECPCCAERFQVLDPWYTARLAAEGTVDIPSGGGRGPPWAPVRHHVPTLPPSPAGRPL